MSDSHPQPARQGSASAVPGELGHPPRSGRAEEGCKKLLSQVFGLIKIPAGLRRKTLEDRKVVIGEIFPRDPVALEARDGQKKVFVMESGKCCEPSMTPG